MNGLARIWIASAVYAAVYIALDLDRYATYHSGADLGLFTQTIASAFHGFSNTVEGGSHFTFHFSPILYLCAPLLWLFHTPALLLVIQACACALAAPPLYLIARRRLPERLALFVAGIAFVYPPLAGVAFSDFHENAFSVAATLWLLWAIDARRFRWAAMFLVVALAIKEDQAAILACASAIGALYFWRRREAAGVRFAWASLAACVLVFVGYFALVRPLAGAAHPWEPLHFYDVAPSDTLPGRPILARFTYLLEAFVPLCFLCFLSPAIILALPAFAELFLSRDSVTYTMGQHYAAVWIGYVLAAFALGVARVARRHPRLATRLVIASLALCVVNLLVASPTHWKHYLAVRAPHDATLDGVLRTLPPDVVVGTHDEIYAHLGFDPNASLGLRYAPPFALFDETRASSYWVRRTRAVLDDPHGRYSMLRQVDGIALYRRKLSAAVRKKSGTAPD